MCKYCDITNSEPVMLLSSQDMEVSTKRLKYQTRSGDWKYRIYIRIQRFNPFYEDFYTAEYCPECGEKLRGYTEKQMQEWYNVTSAGEDECE